jgi:hypothetical protein
MSKNKKDYSIDIRDINYFIDHVKNLEFRVSLLKQLGYKVGVNVVTKDCQEKDITIGKRKEIRIQIAPKTSTSPLVQCAIIES